MGSALKIQLALNCGVYLPQLALTSEPNTLWPGSSWYSTHG